MTCSFTAVISEVVGSGHTHTHTRIFRETHTHSRFSGEKALTEIK